jgi:L-rhamnose mutarotase
MKKYALLCVAALGLACASGTFAQDTKVYKEGPVTDVSFIKVKPGQFDNYMKWLDGPWKKLMEAQKQAGLITSYAVYASQPRNPQEADVILAVTFPNMAALDRADEADAVAAKVLGSSTQQDKGTIDRGSMREVLGSQLMREMILK